MWNIVMLLLKNPKISRQYQQIILKYLNKKLIIVKKLKVAKFNFFCEFSLQLQ